ncbi:hypothetical protein BXZ70DRAFT_902494 [Cristinia sonorae]|uniref:RING-type E3 ubiquitin transferase n=1 Tax=Cristinia sonorae TaxID=1940300 RepID=A0A8K0UF96_9AGAR|nr:hypothetical protein BXZ70DRAFT_902494 [Cristinia sonorae]
MISRPPSSSSRASHRHSEPPPLTEPISAHESTSSSESSESNQSGDADTITPTDSEGGSHALSPGSIDVLGTLLSVAAAATAASLFSPGFSGATPSVGTHPPSTARPLSPTPTAGLGGFGGLNRLAELSMDSSANSARPPAPAPEPQQGDRESRERVRSVWENFRDRLGLGTRGATEDHTGTGSEPSHPENTGDSGAATSPRMRPGEMMLAEMARALNAGLGLAGSAERRSPTDRTALPNAERVASVPPSPQTATAEELTRPLSPDPGFEAFLTNLQADLRTVLSGSHTAASADNNSDEQPSGAGAGPTSHTMSPQHDADVPADVLPFADDMESDFGSINEDTDPPPMSTQQSRHHARTPTPIPPPTTLPRMVASDVEDENPHVGNHRQPAINLWRVYRFPPIPAPPGHALRMSVLPSPEGSQDSSSPSSPADTSATEGSSIGHSAPASSVSPEDSEETPGSAENHDLNVVVPVIVVGLQSVDAAPDRADFEDGPVMPHTHDDGHRHDDLGLDSTDEFGVNHDNASRTGRQADTRGRSWQSRAANALRGFRPGRRNGSRGRRVAESAGSRTFLIYVIGGYYPPNHHVVTGSDSLDSYEALWELADLLGQVKPPVATQEDIEQSGLEIVKAAEMKRHEREGRIASNCTDRCLICLDDYEPENDVRVMSCRHAFHKDCVDKWLQVGRNNCPACRSKVCHPFVSYL